MSKVYPSSFYGDPQYAVKEMKFLERMARREQHGCRRCGHSWDGGLSCDLGAIPGPRGYCNDWTDPK